MFSDEQNLDEKSDELKEQMVTFIETFAILDALVITITLDTSLKTIDLEYRPEEIEECYYSNTLSDIYDKQFGDTPEEAYNNAAGLLVFYSVAGSAILIFSLITTILLMMSLKKTHHDMIFVWLKYSKWIMMIAIMSFVAATTFLILSVGFSVLIYSCNHTLFGLRVLDFCLIGCFVCVGLTFIGMFCVAFLHKQYFDPPLNEVQLQSPE